MPLPTTGAGASANAPPWWNPDGATPGGAGGNCVGAYQGIGAASYALSLVNLANPGTYNLTENNGAVPWAAGTGWGFVAAQQKSFDTGIVPTLNQTWSVLYQYSGLVVVAGTYLFGLYDGVGNNGSFALRSNAANGRSYHGTTASLINNAPVLAANGNYGFAGVTPYRNGIAEPNPVLVGAGTCDVPVYVGALNLNGGAASWATHNGLAFAVYNVTLTPAQALARAVEMAAL